MLITETKKLNLSLIFNLGGYGGGQWGDRSGYADVLGGHSILHLTTASSIVPKHIKVFFFGFNFRKDFLRRNPECDGQANSCNQGEV